MLLTTKFTHADLLAMPEDGKRREIVEGELFVTPSPNLDHQRTSQRAIEVYRLGRERYRLSYVFREPETLTSSMLPNFSLPLADVFKCL